MMTFDKLVSTDLAALAADARRQLVPVDVSLRALEPRRDVVTGTDTGDLVLVAATQIFAARVARAAAGAMALACAVTLLLVVFDPFHTGPAADLFDYYYDGGLLLRCLDSRFIVFAIVSLVAIAYLVGRLVASGIVSRRLRRSLDRDSATTRELAGRLLHRVDRSAIALQIAGVTALVSIAAIAGFAISFLSIHVESERWLLLTFPRATLADRHPAQILVFCCSVFAIVLSVVVGALVARTAARPHRVRRIGMLTCGLLLGLATLCVGLRFDVGPYHAAYWNFSQKMIDLPLVLAMRLGLTAGGTVAVGLVVGAFVSKRRSRESTIVDDSSTSVPLPKVVVGALAIVAVAIAQWLYGLPAGAACLVACVVLWPQDTGIVGGTGLPIAAADLALVARSRMFASRVGTAAFGAALIACAIVVAVFLIMTDDWGQDAHWAIESRLEPVRLTATAICLVLGVCLVAMRYADLAVVRRLRRASNPLEVSRRMVFRMDTWTVLAPAGLTAVVGVIGLTAFAGGERWKDLSLHPRPSLFFFDNPYGELCQAVATGVVRNAAITIALSMVAALVVGQMCRRRSRWLRPLESWWTTIAGFVLGLATLVVGFKLDAGPLDYFLVNTTDPQTLLRLALTITGTIALLLVSFSVAMRHRRRGLEAAGVEL